MKLFVSFQGWKEVFTDKDFGPLIKLMAKKFFSKKFARDYINNSKINKMYVSEHIKQIKKFFYATQNNEFLNARFFRESSTIDSF